MAGKVCVVTGAGSGIGAATAELFAEKGAAAVVCADLDGDAAAAVARRITDAGGVATALAADVADPAAATAVVEHTTAHHGGLHVLHNNAGVGVLGAVHELSDEEWDRCLGVTLRGTFLVSRAALQVMLDGGGAIVHTCSNHATVGSPRLAAYHAAKGGVRALTRQMARDYSPGIRVNCVSPGLVDTPIARRGRGGTTPEEAAAAWRLREESNRYYGRAADPREIAFGVLFLASDESSFLTGHDLVMSGGQGEVAF